MDQKTWLWKRRSSEKTIVTNNKSDLLAKESEEELLVTEKEASLEKSLEVLNEKLASVFSESNAKDELLARHEKMVEEAIAGKEKAEAEAVSLKDELQKGLQQNVASNERLSQLNVALKESMQQLSYVREEQDQRVHDAVMKTSREYEKAQKKLEEKLTEKSKKLSNLTIENTRLSKGLVLKEKLIEDLSECKAQLEAEFNTLMARLDSTEKENTFLKYEFRMLEKELEIRNEEIEFNRQSAELSHKQHMESIKKITKLESECQRLRVLVRKRLPGPATLGKMRDEVGILGNIQSESRRRKLNSITGNLVVRNPMGGNPLDNSSRKLTFLIERLCDVEEENKTLKEIIAKKDDDLHSSQIMCSQTSSRLSMVEAQLGELLKGQMSMELAVCNPISKTLSPTSSFGTGNDEINCSETWASPHKHKSIGASDMSLMDDFVEMEKLAIVTVDAPLETTYEQLDKRGKEVVPVVQGGSNDTEQEIIQKEKESADKGDDWLQNVLKLILDQNHVSKREFDDLLNDIKMALVYMKDSGAGEAKRPESSKLISCYLTWRSPCTSPRLGSNLEKEKIRFDLREEKLGLKDELKIMEYTQEDLEAKLRSANDRSEALMNQLQESEESIGHLKEEVKALRESKGIMEDQIENQKLINADLDTQLTVTKGKLNEVVQKLSSLEVELEDKNHCCEELEATCLELQLQLESVGNKEAPKDNVDQEERLLQTGWEITAASAKLAECQETILNLGKQLKALTSPRETILLSKVFSTNTATTINNKKLAHRSSLRDQMLAEDGVEAEELEKTKEIISTSVEAKKPPLPNSNILGPYESYTGSVHDAYVAAVGSLAIVPSKKRGGIGLLKKLLLRRKRGSGKKTSQLFA